MFILKSCLCTYWNQHNKEINMSYFLLFFLSIDYTVIACESYEKLYSEKFSTYWQFATQNKFQFL